MFLDGQKLADSTQAGAGLNKSEVSALIDTGNSLLRGPQDVVNNILSKVSTAYAANSNASPLLPCDQPHTLAYQIGGKMFPVDPRDFTSQHKKGDVTNCIANNVVATDAPSSGALFSWNLGDPFLKSNMVIFYYGNLTHPSVDPPRIGFVSLVPANATQIFQQAVDDAEQSGNFECMFSSVDPLHFSTDDRPVVFSAKGDAAPTASSLITEGSSSTPSGSSSTQSSVANGVASTATSNPSTTSPPTTVVTVTSSAAPTSSSSAPANGAAASLRVPSGAWSSVLLIALSLLSSLCIL